MNKLTLLPAVDVTGGRAVQLIQGEAGSAKHYGDPLDAALAWQDQGATWLHLVDLDGAFGRGDNAAVLSAVASRVSMNIEMSGGIRNDASLKRALDSGATRVNIGTAALENPQWCDDAIAEYGDRLAVGLDVRQGQLAARGWTREGGDVFTTLQRLEAAGCARYVVTDVNSDGMLAGPNVDLLRQVCERTAKPVIASGGVSTLDDLRVLAGLVDAGVEGVIVGTALYEGRFTVGEALSVLEELWLKSSGSVRADRGSNCTAMCGPSRRGHGS